MEDGPHVGLIDAHPERHGCRDDCDGGEYIMPHDGEEFDGATLGIDGPHR